MTFVGRIVARAEDDSPCPVTGRVTGQVDEDRLEVAWADEQYSDTPRTSIEWFDELRPVRVGKRSLRADVATGPAGDDHLVGRVTDDFGDVVSFYAYPGLNRIVIEIDNGAGLGAEKQDEFARLYQEACRVANGEPPAMEAHRTPASTEDAAAVAAGSEDE